MNRQLGVENVIMRVFALQHPFIDEASDAPLNRAIKRRQFSNSGRIPFNRPGQDAF